MRRPARAGLTLIELLVTISLMVLVAGTVAAVFMGGWRVWERIESHGTQDAWTEVVFDQVRRDLHNVRKFSELPFTGEYNEVSFPFLVESETKDGLRYEELGRLGYYFDAYHHALCRSEQTFRDSRRIRLREACTPVLTDVERVKFRYYGLDPASKTYDWSSKWEAAEPPLAVGLEIRYHSSTAQPPMARSLTVHLPLAEIPKAS